METLASANHEQTLAYFNELLNGDGLPTVTIGVCVRDIPGAIEYRIMLRDPTNMNETPSQCRKRIVTHLLNRLGTPAAQAKGTGDVFQYQWHPFKNDPSRSVKLSYFPEAGLLLRLIDLGAAC